MPPEQEKRYLRLTRRTDQAYGAHACGELLEIGILSLPYLHSVLLRLSDYSLGKRQYRNVEGYPSFRKISSQGRSGRPAAAVAAKLKADLARKRKRNVNGLKTDTFSQGSS